MTQSDLALAADSSTRHLSYLETGRSQPSRDMILRLSEHLGIPLRDQNTLLLAAGFAPVFEERSLAELASARVAIEQILKAHKPYPAFALDRHWNVVLSNSALPQLYEGCSPDLLRKRSEEHTSELQSRPHLVCRLLLEKKKKGYFARSAVPIFIDNSLR